MAPDEPAQLSSDTAESPRGAGRGRAGAASEPPATSATRTRAGDLFTELIFAVFVCHARINVVGDRLSGDFDLSSARLRVLSCIRTSPKTGSQIARERGMTRQNVLQIVRELVREGLVVETDNPHHRSSKLIAISEAGHNSLDGFQPRQNAWADKISEAVSEEELSTALDVLRRLHGRLTDA